MSHSRLFAAVAALSFTLAGGSALASVISPTTPFGLGVNDYILWDQLGPSFTVLEGPQAVTTVNGGGGVSVFSDGGKLSLDRQGSAWSGNFSPQTPVITNFFDQGKITITFADPVKGVGAQIQSGIYGAFHATMHINGGGPGGYTLLEDGVSTDAGDGSAIFLGLLSDVEDITEVTFEVTTDDNNYLGGYFALGPLAIADYVLPGEGGGGTCGGACPGTPPSGAPEPVAWALMILGFGGAGAQLRTRRRRRPAGA
jgi:hypothetical protein